MPVVTSPLSVQLVVHGVVAFAVSVRGVTGCAELLAIVADDERMEIQLRWIFINIDDPIGKLQLLNVLQEVGAVGENSAADERHAAHRRADHAVIAVVNRDEAIAVYVK